MRFDGMQKRDAWTYFEPGRDERGVPRGWRDGQGGERGPKRKRSRRRARLQSWRARTTESRLAVEEERRMGRNEGVVRNEEMVMNSGKRDRRTQSGDAGWGNIFRDN